MISTLTTQWKIKDLCDGYYFNEFERKAVYGLGGSLVIQPSFHRKYLWDVKKEIALINSILIGCPIGGFIFKKTEDDSYELLSGQQRLTAIGRFVTNKFSITDTFGKPLFFKNLDKQKQKTILETTVPVYIFECDELELYTIYERINFAGTPINTQETLNFIYDGPFIATAKKYFDKPPVEDIQKWSVFVKADPLRWGYLEKALCWVSHGDIAGYLNKHRFSDDISELTTYFNTVIDWASSVFTDSDNLMRGLEWDRLYETYHNNTYNPIEVSKEVNKLMSDEKVTEKRGIWEYILSNGKERKLLHVRCFDEATKKTVYERQTQKAKREGTSNCPLCALEKSENANKLWPYESMDADHITAWSNGGTSDISNCQLLCKTHNIIKGNK